METMENGDWPSSLEHDESNQLSILVHPLHPSQANLLKRQFWSHRHYAQWTWLPGAYKIKLTF